MTKLLRYYSLLFFTIFSVGCSNYDFTVNDRVVYTPEPLFSDFSVADSALRACLNEAINDQKATAASDLSSLSCVQAGVESLAGLSTFTELQSLTLSSNNIVDISPLAALTILQFAYLDNNKIIDAVPLYDLPALQLVDLTANPHLLCPDTGSLLRVDDVRLPKHCR
ncbi:MAG: hypothetical protein AAGF57_01445 [Pseudomonadota bacterium]